jgi:hypothetical protein
MEKYEYTPEEPHENFSSFYPVGFHRLIRELQAGRQEFDPVHTICLAWAKSVLNKKEEERPDIITPMTEPSPENSSL